MKMFILSVTATLLLLGQARAQMPEASKPPSAFTGKEAGAIISEALMRQGAGNDIRVNVTEAREDDILLQTNGPVTAEADNVEFDKPHSHWKATLVVKADGRNLAPLKLSGHYDELANVPVLKKRLAAGEIIREEDIDWSKEPAAHLRKNTITESRDLIGKSPKHMISEQRPVRTDEIASPSIIARGAQITMLFRTHNIEIKTIGQAMEPGAKGDVIRVRNVTSKAVIQGTIETADRVRVSSPDIDSAEAF